MDTFWPVHMVAALNTIVWVNVSHVSQWIWNKFHVGSRYVLYLAWNGLEQEGNMMEHKIDTFVSHIPGFYSSFLQSVFVQLAVDSNVFPFFRCLAGKTFKWWGLMWTMSTTISIWLFCGWSSSVRLCVLELHIEARGPEIGFSMTGSIWAVRTALDPIGSLMMYTS